MKSPSNDEVNAVLNRLERPRIELAEPEPRLLPRQPPPTMEFSGVEKQRLRTFMGQAVRMKRVGFTGRLWRLFR